MLWHFYCKAWVLIVSIFVSCLLDKSFLYNYNAALSAKIERRKVNIMKQRKRFRKGIITFILLIALVTVQVVQVTALASEEGQAVQVSTWDDLLASVIASQEGDVIEVMDEITIPSGIALNPSGRITIKGELLMHHFGLHGIVTHLSRTHLKTLILMVVK